MIRLYTKGNLPSAWIEYLVDHKLPTNQNTLMFYEEFKENISHSQPQLEQWLNTHKTTNYTTVDLSENFLMYFLPDDLTALLKLSPPLSFPKS